MNNMCTFIQQLKMKSFTNPSSNYIEYLATRRHRARRSRDVVESSARSRRRPGLVSKRRLGVEQAEPDRGKSASVFTTEKSFGHTMMVNAIVAILLMTPTSVNVVAVMTDRHFQPLYEIATPTTQLKSK